MLECAVNARCAGAPRRVCTTIHGPCRTPFVHNNNKGSNSNSVVSGCRSSNRHEVDDSCATTTMTRRRDRAATALRRCLARVLDDGASDANASAASLLTSSSSSLASVATAPATRANAQTQRWHVEGSAHAQEQQQQQQQQQTCTGSMVARLQRALATLQQQLADKTAALAAERAARARAEALLQQQQSTRSRWSCARDAAVQHDAHDVTSSLTTAVAVADARKQSHAQLRDGERDVWQARLAALRTHYETLLDKALQQQQQRPQLRYSSNNDDDNDDDGCGGEGVVVSSATHARVCAQLQALEQRYGELRDSVAEQVSLAMHDVHVAWQQRVAASNNNNNNNAVAATRDVDAEVDARVQALQRALCDEAAVREAAAQRTRAHERELLCSSVAARYEQALCLVSQHVGAAAACAAAAHATRLREQLSAQQRVAVQAQQQLCAHAAAAQQQQHAYAVQSLHEVLTCVMAWQQSREQLLLCARERDTSSLRHELHTALQAADAHTQRQHAQHLAMLQEQQQQQQQQQQWQKDACTRVVVATLLLQQHDSCLALLLYAHSAWLRTTHDSMAAASCTLTQARAMADVQLREQQETHELQLRELRGACERAVHDARTSACEAATRRLSRLHAQQLRVAHADAYAAALAHARSEAAAQQHAPSQRAVSKQRPDALACNDNDDNNSENNDDDDDGCLSCAASDEAQVAWQTLRQLWRVLETPARARATVARGAAALRASPTRQLRVLQAAVRHAQQQLHALELLTRRDYLVAQAGQRRQHSNGNDDSNNNSNGSVADKDDDDEAECEVRRVTCQLRRALAAYEAEHGVAFVYRHQPVHSSSLATCSSDDDDDV